MRFSRPALCIFRPAVFFSSTATLFSKSLKMSRDLVKEMLRDKGLPEINVMASLFTERDVEALRVSFQSATCNNQIIPPVNGKYLCYFFFLIEPRTNNSNVVQLVKTFQSNTFNPTSIMKNLRNEVSISKRLAEFLIIMFGHLFLNCIGL
jgi:hypothetical protein